MLDEVDSDITDVDVEITTDTSRSDVDSEMTDVDSELTDVDSEMTDVDSEMTDLGLDTPDADLDTLDAADVAEPDLDGEGDTALVPDGDVIDASDTHGCEAGTPCDGPGECGEGLIECDDDGTSRCSTGPDGSDSEAAPELCDERDNDCDGATDEDFGAGGVTALEGALFPADDGKVKGDPCGVGACLGGEVVCAPQANGLVCSTDGDALAERCDGLDNDCDGAIDPGFDYGGLVFGGVCDGVGECGPGLVECAASGLRATCSTDADGSASEAVQETCDDRDNDCDGATDDGMIYAGFQLGASCNGVGECGSGVVECDGTGDVTCSTNPDGSASQVQAETCNSKDDDCDGQTDDNCVAVCNPGCQHGGDCVVGNACDCTGTGYAGPRCETPACTLSCLNGGTCTAPDTCTCTGTGYSGSRCETPVCTQSCLNGGACTAPDTCSCTGTGYSGTRCQTPVCTQSCLNGGTCSEPNTCSCTGTGYSGSRCQTPVCSPACANGTCVAPNSCDCTGTGYSGPACLTPICDPACAHGACAAPDTCNCAGTGYGGPLCEVPLCSTPCANGGTCIAPDTCECTSAFSGLTCETLTGFAKVSPGTFTMGSPTTEVGRNDDETQHSVTISRAFWIKVTEVTQSEWQILMGNNPSGFSTCGGGCPVERVNWFDAVAYANALSAEQGLQACYALSGCTGSPGASYQCTGVTFVGLTCTGYRLPTEAEWERSARAGTTGATYNGNITETGSGSEAVLNGIAWYIANASNTTHLVAQKGPNALGLRDMLGNVAEWVHDEYQAYPSASVTDPLGASGAAQLVVRGGAWLFNASWARAAWRNAADPVNENVIGFRIARTVP